MYNVICVSSVQIVETPRGANTNLKSLLPRQAQRAVAEQVAPEGALLHVLIDEDHLRLILAIANQGYEVAMTDGGEDDDFGLEFGVTLFGFGHATLDCNGSAIAEDAFVDLTEPTGADDEIGVEVVGGELNFSEGDVEAVITDSRGCRGCCSMSSGDVGVAEWGP